MLRRKYSRDLNVRTVVAEFVIEVTKLRGDAKVQRPDSTSLRRDTGKGQLWLLHPLFGRRSAQHTLHSKRRSSIEPNSKRLQVRAVDSVDDGTLHSSSQDPMPVH